MVNSEKMSFSELKSTVILSFIFACRMLGLFMVLPVLTLYVGSIAGATPALIGIASGIYGFTTALFQLPLGVLSDYVGRKPVILIGLLVFGVGSLIAAFSHSMGGLILGRAVQGAGAIGSPILALAADSTRELVRTRVMAIIGVSIGGAFVLALLLGPLVDAYMGLYGIFTMTALLAGGAIFLLSLLGPSPTQKALTLKEHIHTLFRHTDLWGLYLNIFILHAVLMASFLILPHKIQEVTHLTSTSVWRFYLPVLGLAFLTVAPLLRIADKEHLQKKLMVLALGGLGLAGLLLIVAQSWLSLFMGGALFFTAFNFLEACLPSMVSKMAPQDSKGSAMGVYSCAQFLGMFVGGVLGGCLQQWFGPGSVGLSCLVLTIIGLIILIKSKQERYRRRQWQEV